MGKYHIRVCSMDIMVPQVRQDILHVLDRRQYLMRRHSLAVV